MVSSLRPWRRNEYRAPVGIDVRPSSFPLLSGDTFAHACNHLPMGRPFEREHRASDAVWFVEVSDLATERSQDRLLRAAARCGQRPTLVIHNGDVIPSQSFYIAALEVFNEVFSVNIVEERPRLRAIPIGLENCWHRGHGELLEYAESCRSLGGPEEEISRRRIPFFAAFRVETNVAVRGTLEQQLRSIGVPNEATDRQTYRRLTRDSLFVISPPGNGADCHRTWEAIYLGAVPVVLREHIAPSIAAEGRMVVVDDWAEMLELSADELTARYVEYASRPIDSALMSYWSSLIATAAGGSATR